MDNGCRPPTAEEVIARLKDDGDFDSLRLKIIRKVKENEELRNRIVSEVKQSVVLNEDGSEKIKLRELSDAIYQELGSKIMGQISDEVWKIIKSSENDIRGTVEAVYDRIVNPKDKKQDTSSPHKEPQSDGKKGHDSLVTPSTSEINLSDTNEQMEAPPGFDSTDRPSSKVKSEPVPQGKQPQPSNKEPNQVEQVDSLPPGFGPVPKSPIRPIVVTDEDPDVPPGFG